MGVYYEAFRRAQLRPNEAQNQVALLLDGFVERVVSRRRTWFWRRPWFGAYIYGSVGSGKTMLMDLMVPLLEQRFTIKRLHFLEFMQMVRIDRNDNTCNTCSTVWLLDEFQVNDIADAMQLRTVLESVDRGGGWMVCTGNRAPDDLYLNGVQRTSFMPAIELIKRRMLVWHLSTLDHRLLQSKSDSYFWPINADTTRTSN